MFSAASREREPDIYVPYIGHAAPGTVLHLDKDGFTVACGEGALHIAQVQKPGGRRAPYPETGGSRHRAEQLQLGPMCLSAYF